jgi:divalent metal cation (Fe/Co/Zn/Cd) transporter
VLLDRSPSLVCHEIENLIRSVPGVLQYHDLKVRVAGAETFVNITIHVDPELNINEAHAISHKLEDLIIRKIDRCEVQVHYEPEE